MWALVRQFLHHVLPGVLKPLRALWNEVIGFLFLALAAIPIPGTIRSWREFAETGEGLFRVVLSAIFILIMAWFGISSFLRARKISRS
ncbi:MAG: hypothetical protein RMK57_02070 [Bryobacterales bacterium]|nr:hypothetical protein [Bryobacteraceae bacterium]MDW8353291.1 hypothetical protein [Bryobacterales bacterium]